jgi:hypothetical protein
MVQQIPGMVIVCLFFISKGFCTHAAMISFDPAIGFGMPYSDRNLLNLKMLDYLSPFLT